MIDVDENVRIPQQEILFESILSVLCCVLCVFYCIFFLCNTRARTSSDMCLHCMGHGQRLPYHVRRIVICGIFGLANVKWMDRPGINRTSVHFKCFYFVFFFCSSERMVFVRSFRWNRFVRWKYDTGEANLNEIDVVIIGFRRGIIANVDCGAGQNWCDWFIAIHNCDFSAKCYRRKLWMKWRNSFNKFSLFDDIFNSILLVLVIDE